MASQFSIFIIALVFIYSISAAPLEEIPSSFVPPPAGISLNVLNADGNGCFPIAANVSFQRDGNSLSIDYSNFIAYTDFSLGFFDDRGCELVLQVSYPPNYSFYIHDPAFDGNVTLGTGGVAEFDTYSFFGPWLADTNKMVTSRSKPNWNHKLTKAQDADQIQLMGPYNGTYTAFSSSDVTRKWQAPCGSTSANLTIVTRLFALGGTLTSDSAPPTTANIDHKSTVFDVTWTSC